MNLYTGQFIPDRDKDGVPDILNIHGGDPLGEPGMFLMHRPLQIAVCKINGKNSQSFGLTDL